MDPLQELLPDHGLEHVEVPGQLDLFPDPGLQLPGMPIPLPPAETSPDRRRTARQRALVEQGWHPLTGTRTRPELGTCGDCAHRLSAGRRYPKCELRVSASAATDCRAWWPACADHRTTTTEEST